MPLLFLSFVLSTSCGADNSMLYLAKGEAQMASQQWEGAVDSFEKAIATGQLWGPSIAMAYWNLFFANDRLQNIDNAAESLLGFMVHSEDFMWRIRNRESHPGHSWYKTFNVKKRIAFANVVLQAMWASRSNTACRSKLFACVVEETNYISEFQKRIPFCSNNINHTKNDNFIKVNVECPKGREEYYFVVP